MSSFITVWPWFGPDAMSAHDIWTHWRVRCDIRSTVAPLVFLGRQDHWHDVGDGQPRIDPLVGVEGSS